MALTKQDMEVGIKPIQHSIKMKTVAVDKSELEEEPVKKNEKSDDKKSEKRKVISITYSDWRKLRNYAFDNDTTITAAVTELIEQSSIM